MATVIDDNATLEVTGAQTANKSQLEHGVTYTVATYNIGFGASRDLLRRFLVLWQMSYLRCLPKRLANTSAGLNRTFPGLIASKRVTRRIPPKLPPQVTPQVRRLVAALGMDQLSAATLKERLGLSDTKSFRALYLRPALNEHLIEMTIPDKPRSRNQQYRLTSKGHALLRNSGA